MKSGFKSIAVIAIISLLNYNLIAPNVPWESGSRRVVTTLAPELITRPIVSTTAADPYVLESFIRYKLAKDPLSAETKSDISSDLGDKTVYLFFSRAVNIPIKGEAANVILTAVPCLVDKSEFYAYFVSRGEGETRFTIQPAENYEKILSNVASKGFLESAEFARFSDAFPTLRGEGFSFVDATDESVRMASGFLNAVGARLLSARLLDLVENKKLVMTDGPALVTGAMSISTHLNARENAWSIIEQFLELADGNRATYLKSMQKTFMDFTSGAKPTGTVRLSPELQKNILLLETIIGSASNEGGIKFSPAAMQTTVDVSDVTLEDCRKEGIIGDIERVFADVAWQDMKEHNELAPPDKQIRFEDMPGNRIVIRRLSNAVLPTAVSQENGVIYVNEDFVKVMYKFAQMGLRSNRAKMGKVEGEASPGTIVGGVNAYSSFVRGEGSSYLGNFYFSLLYSIAIHEIRGHFSLDDGVAVLSLDENFAQGERGRGHIVPNLAATLIFWQYVIEGKCSGTSHFAAQFPHLERYLSKWDNHNTLDNALSLAERPLSKNGPKLMKALVGLPRVPVAPGDFVLTPSDSSASKDTLQVHPVVTQAIQSAEKALKELQEANTPLGVERRAWDAIKPVETAFLIAVRKGNLDSAYSLARQCGMVVLDRVSWVEEYAKQNDTGHSGTVAASLAVDGRATQSGILYFVETREGKRTDDMIAEINNALKLLAKGAYDSALPGKGEPREAPTSIEVARTTKAAEAALVKLKRAYLSGDVILCAIDSVEHIRAAIAVASIGKDMEGAFSVAEESVSVILDRAQKAANSARDKKSDAAKEYAHAASGLAEQAMTLIKSRDSSKIADISALLSDALMNIAHAFDSMIPRAVNEQNVAAPAPQKTDTDMEYGTLYVGHETLDVEREVPAVEAQEAADLQTTDHGPQAAVDGGLSTVDSSSAMPEATIEALRVRIFELLAIPEKPALTAKAIASRLEIKQDETLAGALAELVQMGALYRLVNPKKQSQGEVYFSVLQMTSWQAEGLLAVLRDARNAQEPVDEITLKSEAYKVLEPSWANVLVNEVTKGDAAKAASIAGQKMVFVIETDWIPSEQQSFVAGLVQEIEKLGDKGAFVIVRASSKDVKTKLMETLQKENIPMDRAIVLASKNTVWGKDFAPLVSRNNEDKTKPFVFAVDPKELKSDSYIKVVQMMLIALRLTTTQLSCSVFKMKIQKYNDRLFLIMPSADPMSFDDMKKLYDAQRHLIHTAA